MGSLGIAPSEHEETLCELANVRDQLDVARQRHEALEDQIHDLEEERDEAVKELADYRAEVAATLAHSRDLARLLTFEDPMPENARRFFVRRLFAELGEVSPI